MVCSKRTALLIGVNALVGSVCVLDVSGVLPVKQSSLRGSRRLQQIFGQQEVSNGFQTGSNMANQGMQMGGNIANQGMQMGSNMANQGMQMGGQVAQQGMGIADQGWRYGNRGKQFPWSWDIYDILSPSVKILIPILQAIFAVLYYCMVVNNYPYWNGPTPQSCQIQNEPAPCSLTSTSPSNCCLSWCCPQARAAHTFDKTGTLEYWCGCLAMFCCPFCTLCWANACTDLNPKLGGEPANPIASAVCTWCCSCCVIAQDAESLDACTGARTEPCGVSGGMPPYPYPTPYGPYPGQMMMQPGMY